ncbi:protein kinase superfamily protein [Striga asiatica]|uniref:Protein kinase superfamily protein n=1 Tax=Striga asiatica TaxID=4170 RepID=A0A5A7PAZ6_STRAF|nr:protein kinase superfamily protein [Striga asiatica]
MNTLSAMLCGSVAWPRLARTLGRTAGARTNELVPDEPLPAPRGISEAGLPLLQAQTKGESPTSAPNAVSAADSDSEPAAQGAEVRRAVAGAELQHHRVLRRLARRHTGLRAGDVAGKP